MDKLQEIIEEDGKYFLKVSKEPITQTPKAIGKPYAFNILEDASMFDRPDEIRKDFVSQIAGINGANAFIMGDLRWSRKGIKPEERIYITAVQFYKI